jgi:hypothetical protein
MNNSTMVDTVNAGTIVPKQPREKKYHSDQVPEWIAR